MDETRLRRRFQEATRRSPGKRETCPSSDELSRLGAGALEPTRRSGLLDHVTFCHDCSAELRAALSLREWSRDVEGARRHGPSVRWWALGAAATLTAAALSIALLSPERREPASRYREAEPAAVRSLVEEETTLPREAFLLRWSPAADGSSYELRVTDEDLRLLYRARGLDEPEHVVPPTALEDVSSGERLLWQIEVREPTGVRDMSPAFSVRVQ